VLEENGGPLVDLRAERLNRGMDERTFARECGVTQPVIQRLERPGQHRVRPVNAKKVADYIGCKVTDLIGHA
jgi:transcriptional regulator with XRE-family HTH domain